MLVLDLKVHLGTSYFNAAPSEVQHALVRVFAGDNFKLYQRISSVVYGDEAMVDDLHRLLFFIKIFKLSLFLAFSAISAVFAKVLVFEELWKSVKCW